MSETDLQNHDGSVLIVRPHQDKVSATVPPRAGQRADRPHRRLRNQSYANSEIALAAILAASADMQKKRRKMPAYSRQSAQVKQPASSMASTKTSMGAEQFTLPDVPAYPIKPVPSLHKPGNGLLSATRIAEFFQMSWEELAQALSVSPEFLRQNAATTPVQLRLLGFERIAAALLFLAGNKENADLWLSLPEAQISDQTPLSFIKAGHGHIIAEMLEDMIWGQPS